MRTAVAPEIVVGSITLAAAKAVDPLEIEERNGEAVRKKEVQSEMCKLLCECVS